MSKDQNPSDKACDAYFDNPYAATSGSYYSDRVTFYAGFAAGAASRDAEVYTKQGAIDMLNQWNDELLAQIKQKDAEIAELKTVPTKYRRMAFNAQLQAEVAELAKENNQLRAQINVLREALSSAESALDESRDYPVTYDEVITALSSTPKQSLAEYRNKAIEECAKRAEAYAYMSQNFNALAEELRAMKEQP